MISIPHKERLQKCRMSWTNLDKCQRHRSRRCLELEVRHPREVVNNRKIFDCSKDLFELILANGNLKNLLLVTAERCDDDCELANGENSMNLVADLDTTYEICDDGSKTEHK